jgi:hypothetical protein
VSDGPSQSPELACEGVAPRASRKLLKLRQAFAAVARQLVEAIPAIVLVNATVFYIYRPWGSRLRTPFVYGGDAFPYAMFVDAMRRGPNYGYNSIVGAPHGASNYDFPLGGDRLQLFALRVISWFVQDSLLVVHLYYLACFTAIALSAYVVFRWLKFGISVSTLGSYLFAIAPYHFFHGPSHLFLSAYYSVPLVVYLIIWATVDHKATTQLSSHRPRRILFGGDWRLATCCVIAAGSSSYYALFAVLVLAAITATKLLSTASIRLASRPLLVAVALLTVHAAMLLPELIWQLREGNNPAVANRAVFESEFYGLHFAQAVTPEPTTRLHFLADLSQRARQTVAPGELGTYLGAGAIVGLLYILVVLVRRPRGVDKSLVTQRRSATGQIAGWCFAFGTVSGLGMLVAVMGFTQLRVWGRISIILTFVGLVGLLELSESIQRRFRFHPAAGSVLLVSVVAVGSIDQIPLNVAPDFTKNAELQREDREFVSTLQQQLDDGAMVFQLPAISYPENGPVHLMADYDHFRMPLASDGSLRFSYGGLRGRDSDWQTRLQSYDVEQVSVALAVAGFDALYIDRNGYPDGAADLETRLRPIVGDPVAESASGRLVWYDLRALSERLRSSMDTKTFDDLHQAVTRRIALWDLGDRPYDARHESGDKLELRNEAEVPVTVRLSFSVVTNSSTPVVFKIDEHTDQSVSPVEGRVDVELIIPPGVTSIEMSTTLSALPGGDPRDDFQLTDLRMVDVQLDELLTSIDAPSLLGPTG